MIRTNGWNRGPAGVANGLALGTLWPDERTYTGPDKKHAFDIWTARAIAVTIVSAHWLRAKGRLCCQKG